LHIQKLFYTDIIAVSVDMAERAKGWVFPMPSLFDE
jgi:hypothetical protein